MIEEIRLPEISENVDSGDVIRLLVKIGDRIEVDQPVVELETEKASFEVPSPVKGKVVEISVKEGQNVKVGQVLLKVDTEAAQEVKPAEPAPETQEAKPPAEEPPREEKAPPKETPKPAPPEPQAAARRRPHAEKPGPSGPVAAAPSVRQLARELGIDIGDVAASGEAGRVTAEDVKEHARRIIAATAGAPPSGVAPAFKPLPDFSAWGEIERQKVSTIRKKIADTLSCTWATVPQVTQYDQADITGLEESRKRYVQPTGRKLTVTAIVLKVAAKALKAFPVCNAVFDPQREEIIYRRYCHISVAVDTDRGLLVPVIRDVDKKGILELSDELNDLAERTRQHKVAPDEMGGGGFTVTNLGGIGGTAFAPILYWPQSAILGIARASMQPVVRDGRIEGRMILPLSLSYDHRIIDGAEGVRFLRFIVNTLENPLRLALDEND
jgi:pyruvate dehydrogenase E2 component (dihydrolipoamide acetyltransferase)